MKVMKTRRALLATALIPAVSAGQHPNAHQEWLIERLKEATSIKPGMGYSDFIKVFKVAGGFNTSPPRRYWLRSCFYISVDVTFKKKSPPRPRLEDEWLETGTIDTISKPYLDWPSPD
jgi:hypothetical protein